MSHTRGAVARNSANGIIELFRIFCRKALPIYSIVWSSILCWETNRFYSICPIERCCRFDQSDIIFQCFAVVFWMVFFVLKILHSPWNMHHLIWVMVQNLWAIKHESWLAEDPIKERFWPRDLQKKMDKQSHSRMCVNGQNSYAHSYKNFSSMNLIKWFTTCFERF